ncbi:MAG: glycosyltransferase [Deltaproteobacteria bacterium]|nr:glycosyltransferase [Deltaproteobacteria bacterium]
MIYILTPTNTQGAARSGETALTLEDLMRLRKSPLALLRRILFAPRHERCAAVVSDLRTHQRFFFIKLLCLLTPGSPREIVDLDGRTMPVRWGEFLASDLPEMIVDLARAPFAMRGFKRGLAELLSDTPAVRSIAPTAEKSVWFYRTDLFFGVKAGGSVGHITGVCKGFTRLGFAVTAFAADSLEFLRPHGIPVEVVPMRKAFRNFPELRTVAYEATFENAMRERARASRPALVYQRLSLNNFAGAECARAWNVPFVLEYNGSEVWVSKHWGQTELRLAKWSLQAEDVCFRHADLIVVVSAVLRDELVSRGVPADKILVNPNAVDPEIYDPDRFDETEIARLRESFGFSPGDLVFGFIGTFSMWHGVEVLAEAISRLVAERDDLRFLLIGDGPLHYPVRERLKAAGVGDRCVLTGLVPQMEAVRHLAACDAYLSPHVPNPDGSRFFGSPTKLFEYMAMGRAIVASDLEQIGEILAPDETALLVNPGMWTRSCVGSRGSPATVTCANGSAETRARRRFASTRGTRTSARF